MPKQVLLRAVTEKRVNEILLTLQGAGKRKTFISVEKHEDGLLVQVTNSNDKVANGLVDMLAEEEADAIKPIIAKNYGAVDRKRKKATEKDG